MKSFKLFFLFLLMPAIIVAQETSTSSKNIEEVIEKAKSLGFLRSLLVQQNEELVVEKFFGNATPDYPYNIKSVSKSIISLLTGIAVDKGFIASVDESIATYFPEYFAQNPDSIKEAITIKNLLTMQAGLKSTSREHYGKWIISDNWIEYVLDQSMVEKPGGEMIYSTGTSHLLSAIIAKASGMNIKQFAQIFLFRPMNIRVGDWGKDPQGYYIGGNNMALIPKDLLKIGQMVLDAGRYKGERILPKEWIITSLKTHVSSPINPYNYGYMWWNTELKDYTVFFAWGFGGQYIFLLPQLNAVVVVTSVIDPADNEREYQYPIFDLLKNNIIPYLED